MMLRTPILPILIAALSLMSAGCGFQLRGSSASIAQSYSSVRVVDLSGDGRLRKDLKQALTDTGTNVTATSLNVVEILQSEEDKRTASYSSRGKSAEYELLKEIRFQFKRDEKVLIPETTFKARRSYLYRETAAVGKAEEENMLKREMDQDLVHTLTLVD